MTRKNDQIHLERKTLRLPETFFEIVKENYLDSTSR